MKLEDQVVSLELAREMKELGAEQDSIWYWIWAAWRPETKWVIIPQDRAVKTDIVTFSAYTMAELGEMLPAAYNSHELIIDRELNGSWNVRYISERGDDPWTSGKKAADALAQMWIRKVNRMKKKLVWKDRSPRVVSKSVVVGHFAMWAVRQSPYLFPKGLDKGIEEFSQARGFGNDNFLETTCANLQMIISDALSKSTIVSSWNVAKKGTGPIFVSRFNEPKPDYDFIDLEALARNVAHSVWLEIFYDEGEFE